MSKHDDSDFLCDPIVIDPPDFDLKAAWGECREATKDGFVYPNGEVNWEAAFSADPGCCSCPACRKHHWAWGRRQRCTGCGFEYPTGWYGIVREGQDDRGTQPLPTTAPKHPDCPYYMQGWHSRGTDYHEIQASNWRSIVASFAPWSPTPEEAASIATAVHGDCKHWRGTQEKTCAAGVEIRPLAGEGDGWCTRLPCVESFRNRANGPVGKCSLFAVLTPEEAAAEEAESERLAEEFMWRLRLLTPLISRLKLENKGKSASGIAECPVCDGKLRWGIAAYNGHIRLDCETVDCVSMME